MCVCGEVEAESEGGSESETGGKGGSEGGGQRVCHLSRHQRTNPPQKPRRVVAAPCALRCRRRHRRARAHAAAAHAHAAAAAAALDAHRAQCERPRPGAHARAVPLCEADCEVRVVRATHLELRIGPRCSKAVGSETLGTKAPQPQPHFGTQAARALLSGLEGRPEQAGAPSKRAGLWCGGWLPVLSCERGHVWPCWQTATAGGAAALHAVHRASSSARAPPLAALAARRA